MESILDQYESDWRRMYVEQPRVRLDGVYIAVCHYMYVCDTSFLDAKLTFSSRTGLSENPWVKVRSPDIPGIITL
jgi:F-box protein 9